MKINEKYKYLIKKTLSIIWIIIGATIVIEMIMSLIWVRISHSFDFIVPAIFFTIGIYSFMIYIALNIIILITYFIIKHIIKI